MDIVRSGTHSCEEGGKPELRLERSPAKGPEVREISLTRESTLHQLFETQVQSYPDAIAVIHQEITLRYRKLNEEANRLSWSESCWSRCEI